jgi:putative oxidoreductase
MPEALLRAARDLNQKREIGLDLLRIYLGIGLFVRGALFISRPEALLQLIASNGDWFWPAAIAHYVAAVHIFGGFLLTLGAYTRLAAAVQLPVLAGAVFVTHWGEGLLSRGQSLEFAGLVLFMLLVFTVFGAGPLSVDARLRRKDSSLQAGPISERYAPGGAQ